MTDNARVIQKLREALQGIMDAPLGNYDAMRAAKTALAETADYVCVVQRGPCDDGGEHQFVPAPNGQPPRICAKCEEPERETGRSVSLLDAAIRAREVIGDWVQGVQPTNIDVCQSWAELDAAIKAEPCVKSGVECAGALGPVQIDALGQAWSPEFRALAYEIEALPASEQQTKVITMFNDLHRRVAKRWAELGTAVHEVHEAVENASMVECAPSSAERFREWLLSEVEAMVANMTAAQEPERADAIGMVANFIRSTEIDGCVFAEHKS